MNEYRIMIQFLQHKLVGKELLINLLVPDLPESNWLLFVNL